VAFTGAWKANRRWAALDLGVLYLLASFRYWPHLGRHPFVFQGCFLVTICLALFRAVAMVFQDPSVAPRPAAGTKSLFVILLLLGTMNVGVIWTRFVDDSGVWCSVGARYVLEKNRLPYGQFVEGPPHGPLMIALHIPTEAIWPVREPGMEWGKPPVPGLCGTFVPPQHVGDYRSPRIVITVCCLCSLAALVVLGRQKATVNWGLAWACAYAASPLLIHSLNRVSHLMPAVFVLCALALMSRPVCAGVLMGLGACTAYFPAFALPLWFGWYFRRDRKQAIRFAVAVSLVGITALAAVWAFTEPLADHSPLECFWRSVVIQQEGAESSARWHAGFWAHVPWEVRLWTQRPLIFLYFLACAALAFVPRIHNARQLVALNAALFLGVHLWKSHLGGSYAAWYLGLFLVAALWPRNKDKTEEVST